MTRERRSSLVISRASKSPSSKKKTREQDLHEGSWEHDPTVERDTKNQKLLALDSANRAMVGSVTVVAEDSPNKPVRRSRLGVGQLVCRHRVYVWESQEVGGVFYSSKFVGSEKAEVETEGRKTKAVARVVEGEQECERKEGERKGKKKKGLKCTMMKEAVTFAD